MSLFAISSIPPPLSLFDKRNPILLRPLVKNLESPLSLLFQTRIQVSKFCLTLKLQNLSTSHLFKLFTLCFLYSPSPVAFHFTQSKMQMLHLRGPAGSGPSSVSDLNSYCPVFPHSSLAHWSPSLCSPQGLCIHESLLSCSVFSP